MKLACIGGPRDGDLIDESDIDENGRWFSMSENGRYIACYSYDPCRGALIHDDTAVVRNGKGREL